MGTPEPKSASEVKELTKPKPVPKLTRQQRRYMERVEDEAKAVYSLLTEKFLACFMANDPESDEVTNKAKEVIAKWRVYCANKRLNDRAAGLMEKYCESISKQYEKASE